MDKTPQDLQREKEDRHNSTLEWLPWYANGSISDMERAVVKAHLDECAACRLELEQEHQIVSAMRQSALPERSPEPGLEQLLDQIAALEARKSRASGRIAILRWLEQLTGWHASAAWKAALAGASAFALVLGVALTSGRLFGPGALPTNNYHVLGSAAVAPAAELNDIHLVLAPSVDVMRRQALLDAVGGRIVGGPNSVGAITVRIGTDGQRIALSTVLERLRREPDVVFAEAAMPASMPRTEAE